MINQVIRVNICRGAFQHISTEHASQVFIVQINLQMHTNRTVGCWVVVWESDGPGWGRRQHSQKLEISTHPSQTEPSQLRLQLAEKVSELNDWLVVFRESCCYPLPDCSPLTAANVKLIWAEHFPFLPAGSKLNSTHCHSSQLACRGRKRESVLVWASPLQCEVFWPR